MAALDVICIDFQLWLRIDLRFLGKQQIVIGLVSIRAVRALVHDCLAIPYAAAFAVEDTAVFLPRRCRTCAMIDTRVVVNMLPFAGKVEPVKRNLGTRLGDVDDHVVAYESTAQVKPCR